MNEHDRVTVYLVAQFVAVAVLHVVVGWMLGWFGGDVGRGTTVPGTVVTWLGLETVRAVTLAELGAPVAGVTGAVVYAWRTASVQRILPVAALTVVCGMALAVVTLFASLLTPPALLVVLVGGWPLVAGIVGARLGLFGPGRTDSGRRPGVTATRLAVGVLCLGCVLGFAMTTAGGALFDVESEYYAYPKSTFEFSYNPVNESHGVVNVTHRGGEPVVADQLFVRGTGIVRVAGADQARPGRWRGEATGSSLRDSSATPDSETVRAGDSVRVGVTDGCRIRVIHRVSPWATTRTMAEKRCSNLQRQSQSAAATPSPAALWSIPRVFE